MPKKRNHLKSFKPSSPAPAAASSSADKPSRGVNELLANSRRAALGPSSGAGSSALPANSPSVPPDIRAILQIPETPPLAPRRARRQRFDGNGRRLPAGPPPPRSWVARVNSDSHAHGVFSRSLRVRPRNAQEPGMPGAYLPTSGSLIDMVLRRLAVDWEFHRVYNQYHIFFLPTHLKPALIRLLSAESDEGISLADLKLVLLPPSDAYEGGNLEDHAVSNAEVTYIDLSRSVGRSIRVKDVTDLLFETRQAASTSSPQEPQDSWDAADMSPSPPHLLLPNLTHLSLAVDPRHQTSVSWKQLLNLSTKLRTVTHLSLAYWPDPCLTPHARFSTVTTPQGRNIPYGGTNYYSHTLDQDWSEALLVLRMLSRNMYALEYLDLTGCSAWFKALVADSEHDYVDWAGNWGKITLLRLYSGWTPQDDAQPSERIAYEESTNMAGLVERHIRSMRAGQGRFITVERDVTDN